MNIYFDVMLVRTLKGAPLSVFILLSIARQPLGAQYLEENSGYTTKSVNAALHILKQYGLITRNSRYAWQITRNALQLPLMKTIESLTTTTTMAVDYLETDQLKVGVVGVDNENLLPGSGKNSMSPVGDESGRWNNSMSFSEKTEKTAGSGKNSMSEVEKFHLPHSSSSSLINLEQNLEISPLPLLGQDDLEKTRIQECRAICDQVGIEDPKKTLLCKKPFVTSELIKYHCQTAANVKLAIYRIDNNWRIPKGWVIGGGSDSINQPERINNTMKDQLQPINEPVELWDNIKKMLSEIVSKAEFDTWIKPAKLSIRGEQGYTLTVYNKVAAEWIDTNVLKMITDLLNADVVIDILGSVNNLHDGGSHDQQG